MRKTTKPNNIKTLTTKGWRFKGNELKYLREVLSSDFKSSASGSMLARFEKKFAHRLGIKYAIGTNSGTSALYEALVSCNVGPQDEVIVPALTVAMLGFAVIQAQARPVFADVRKNTFLLDPEDVKRKITPRTKAIIAVHMYGQMCDMEALTKISRGNNLRLIEDCAQCYLAKDNKGRFAGTVGDIGCFSLSDTKMITTGEGGIVVTNNPELTVRIRKLAYLGFKNLSADSAAIRFDSKIFQDPGYLRHDAFGHSYFMSEPTAAIALAQVERIDEFYKKRVMMAELYRQSLKKCSWLIPQQITPRQKPAFWTFVALYEGKEKLNISWEQFRIKFIEFGGDKIRACWALVYDEPSIQNVMRSGHYFSDGKPQPQFYCAQKNWQKPHCPIAEYIQPRLMQFTTNQNSKEERRRQEAALIKTIKYFENHAPKTT